MARIGTSECLLRLLCVFFCRVFSVHSSTYFLLNAYMLRLHCTSLTFFDLLSILCSLPNGNNAHHNHWASQPKLQLRFCKRMIFILHFQYDKRATTPSPVIVPTADGEPARRTSLIQRR